MAVEHLEELLAGHVGDGKKIVDTRFTNLVAPGENYGGELLRLEVTTEDEATKEKEVLHVVAKKIPTNELLQEFFNIQQTVKSEILFYEKLVPAVQKFQRENGLEEVTDCFAEFYGGRLNLNGSDVVDSDAVIIMENLIVSGYKNLDRHIGYDLHETKIVLKDLAIFQSSFTALKIKKPDYFFKEIRPLCNNVISPAEGDTFNEAIVLVEELLAECPGTAPFLPQVRKVWSAYGGKEFEYEPREPFATFAHCDLWVNNAMMKYEGGKAVKNKLVDFQLYNYKSPVIDVLNFLVTSVQTEVLKQEFDNLLDYYHTLFIENLRRMGCDTKPFSYSKFQEELVIENVRAFAWAILFIPLVVFSEKDKDSAESAEMNYGDPEVQAEIKRKMLPEAKERLFFLVETFGKKGWLEI